MAMHDWTRVIAGIFHHFHQRWIASIADALNGGLLPPDFYALSEQVAEGPIPDILTLERVSPDENGGFEPSRNSGGLAVAEHPPRVRYTLEAEQRIYAEKANRVTVFHATGDEVVAYVEIVSPGNKQSEREVQRFLDKLAEAMRRGCHLLIIDPHPPTRRDPQGLHARFWSDYFGQADTPGVSPQQPLSLAAYRADLVPTAYFEPVAVGDPLSDMPLFFTPDRYASVPLEKTYIEAWNQVPERWRRVIEPTASK
jgi:hypothetical protein